MKKSIILLSFLGMFACKKFGSELNYGKDGCIDCVLKIDSINGVDTTYTQLKYDIWSLKTDRTDWCNYLNDMNGKTVNNDTILVKYTVSCN